MLKRRLFSYKVKNQLIVSRIIISQLFNYNIGLNNSVSLNEIKHFANYQKGDLGVINFFKTHIFHMKVDVANRFKIFDENLVEDNRTTYKVSYCIR